MGSINKRLPSGTLDGVLLLGVPAQDADYEAEQRRLLPALAIRLGLPPDRCRLEFREQPALAAIEHWRAAGCRRVVVLPLTLEADDHLHEGIWGALDWERVRHPQMTIVYGSALTVQPALVQVLAARVAAALPTTSSVPVHETALLVVGRGSNDPEQNAEIARLARLLWEGRPYGWVEAAYYRQTQPNIAAGLQRCLQVGARQIVVVPYWLYLGSNARSIAAQVTAFQTRPANMLITLAAELADHPGVITALANQAIATASGQSIHLRRHGHSHSHTHGPEPTTLSFLPPRYRTGSVVSATPMGAAPLVYDTEGRVAWDQIWGKEGADQPFCELALAGGPPHRGQLLEPPTAEVVKADWTGYGRVLAELTRGIQLTTSLRTHLSQALGWIGVECHSEEMAIWLLRAITVENVSVRRESAILYLPAGPAFRLEGEIKNVITALAKTYHYWQEHLHG